MAIEGFNYKEFIEDLSSQAEGILPADFQNFQKQYVIKTVRNFSNRYAETMNNDDKTKYSAYQAMFITQIISEWTFYKSIDIIKAGIPYEYWDGILDKIAFTIFAVVTQAVPKGLSDDQSLQIAEHHVHKSYKEALTGLNERGYIDKFVLDNALRQSSIEDMIKTRGYK